MYRLIAADMDDTLLDQHGVLTQRTVDAIKRAMAAGAYMILASGRMLESIAPYAERISVNGPIIAYNGALVCDLAADRAISQKVIPRATAKGVLKMAREHGIYVQAYPGKGYYAQYRTDYTGAYEKSIGVECVITGEPLNEFIDSDCVKLLMIGEKEKTLERIDMFSKAFPDVSFMMSRPHYIEVVARGIDKAAALEAAANALDVKREQTIAFGDGQNDLSMIAWAGKGYCMANATEGVRAQCSLFAPSNAEDGCAQVIESLLAEGKIGG